MAQPRRKSDHYEEDHTPERGISLHRRGLNGHTKWVVGVVSTAIVSALAFLLVQDRNGFERRLIAVEAATLEMTRYQSAHGAESAVRWDEIKRSLEEIKADLKEVKRQKR